MGVQCVGHISRAPLWQGEDRDSSDEEWSSAYAALDPMSKIGWGNRGIVVNGGGAQLVRDVLLAADVMHEEAMSAMDGNEEDDEDIECNGDYDPAPCEPPLLEGCLQADGSADGTFEGVKGGVTFTSAFSY